MPKLNLWWETDPRERYWMEVTDRPDIGADLNAPAKDESGDLRWSYNLIRAAVAGDVVFHYSKNARAVVGSSLVRGEAWPDEVLWGARGTSARARNISPYARAGFRRSLSGFIELRAPLPLQAVASRRSAVFAIKRHLEDLHAGSLYFPFAPYRDSLRPTQGYMMKFPVALVQLLDLPER